MFDKKINIDTDTEKYCNILVRYWYWLSIFLHSVPISILQYISDTDTCYFFSVSAKSLDPNSWFSVLLNFWWCFEIKSSNFGLDLLKTFQYPETPEVLASISVVRQSLWTISRYDQFLITYNLVFTLLNYFL